MPSASLFQNKVNEMKNSIAVVEVSAAAFVSVSCPCRKETSSCRAKRRERLQDALTFLSILKHHTQLVASAMT
jgi:hypothetical protein